MRELGDEYVSTEHLLLAIAKHPGKAGDALRSNGATHDQLIKALSEVRGSHRVTDENPEDKYQALERYGRDLVDGKAHDRQADGRVPEADHVPGKRHREEEEQNKINRTEPPRRQRKCTKPNEAGHRCGDTQEE